MCKCDYEYGGDFLHPLPSGKNPYKLWSLSIYFNTLYVANYLYILFILVVNEFWEDLIGNNVLNTCYEDTVRYWLLLHFVKPVITMIIVNCCGLHKLFCCACSKLCLISFIMLSLDITFGVLAMYYCWLDLFYIYSRGNANCNISLPPQFAIYNYDQRSLIFILLSFLAIHFIFIWLELFRFVEILTFQHNKKKLKRMKSKRNQNQKLQMQINDNKNYESVDIEDVSKSIDDNKLVDIVYKEAHDAKINENMDYNDNDNEQEISIEIPIGNFENNNNNNIEINQWIQELFVYGIGNNERQNENENENDMNENNGKKSDSKTLSHFWKATTMVVTTGFILELTADDFCCVCWEEFEIGHNIAKLICGHIIHKQCAIEWFDESTTCPTCRISLEKN